MPRGLGIESGGGANDDDLNISTRFDIYVVWPYLLTPISSGRRTFVMPSPTRPGFHPSAPPVRGAVRLRFHRRARCGPVPAVVPPEGAQGRGIGHGPPRGALDVLHGERRGAGRASGGHGVGSVPRGAAERLLLRAALFLDHISTILAILRWERVQGFGIALEFYGSHPTHGPFLLRAIGRIVAFFVLPGYVLMLVTGLWMVNMAWPLTTRW